MSNKKRRAIMLVDDNDLDNLINRKTIEYHKLSEVVYVYTTAKGAIEFLKNVERLEIAKDIIPNLIILDIDMPFMDGFQFLDEFKKLSKLVRDTCKIMLLTSSKSIRDFDQSKNYKSVAKFARKPLSPKDILAISI